MKNNMYRCLPEASDHTISAVNILNTELKLMMKKDNKGACQKWKAEVTAHKGNKHNKIGED
jgi:hypothetical protein